MVIVNILFSKEQGILSRFVSAILYVYGIWNQFYFNFIFIEFGLTESKNN